MKKITQLLAIAFFVIVGTSNLSAKTATSIPSYFVDQAFTGAIAYPAGWADATALIGSNNAGVSWTTPAANQLNVAGSGSGSRGRSMSFTTSGLETLVYVDFDFFVTSAMIGQKNALGIILQDNAGNNIMSLYSCGSDAKFHYWNQDTDTAAFIGGSFNRASGTSLALTNSQNIQTQINFPYSTGTWFNLKATLDFTNHMVTNMTLTKKSDATNISIPNMAFINPLAADLTKISVVNTRSSTGGNGSNANLNISIDNFKTYKLIEASTDQVTVNYKDALGNVLKTARVQTELEIGTTYTATTEDKATFADASFYYAYDATSTDNVVVATGGASVIDLIFKKTAITPGTYTWTGITSSVWNNGVENFTTDAVNSLGFQNDNPVIFPAAATNKIVDLSADLTFGANDINLSGDAYALSGLGSLAGTGKFILNTITGETTTLGIKNNLAGGVTVNGGTAVLTNDLGSAGYTLADGATLKLQTGAGFSKPIAGTGTITLEAATNSYYTMPVTGASTVNVILDNAGSGTSATWTDYFGGSFPSGAQINVTTGIAAAGFGVQGGVLTNNKVNLGDGIRLLHWYNQSSSGGGVSTITVGELSGTAASTVEGGMVDANNRHLAYEIGALNTDATFGGVIKNFGTVTAANLNIYKKGTGTWTLTGTSTYFPGVFNVDAGKVVLNGALSGAVPVTVAAGAILEANGAIAGAATIDGTATVGATGTITGITTVGATGILTVNGSVAGTATIAGTLKGTGTIAGATTVNGVLEGKLNFGSSLVLAGTTKIVVDGFEAGQFDVVNVTGAVTYGGVLEITVNAATPTQGTAIKIMNFATQTGNFTQPITAPSNYSFDPATGTLTYDGVTGFGENGLNQLSIYPTLSRGMITITGEATSVEIANLAGQVVKQATLNTSKSEVSLSDLSTGAYFVKVRSIDGSVKVQKVIYQK